MDPTAAERLDEPDQPTTDAPPSRYDTIFGRSGIEREAPLVHAAAPRRGAAHPAAAGFARGLARWLRTAVLTLAAMYVAGFGLIVGLESVGASTGARGIARNDRVTRAVAANDAAGRYRLPTDPSITPEAAGVALAALFPEPSARPGLVPRPIADRPGIPWRGIPIPREVFSEASPGAFSGLPTTPEILAIARRGLTPDQRRALRMVATAGFWSHLEMVAVAGSVDILAGRYLLPFGSGTDTRISPTLPRRSVLEFGGAGLARAAWHLAEARPDAAERALRTTLSFGLAVRDNATFAGDRLAGNGVVSLAADGLVRLWELTGDPRGRELAAARDSAARAVVLPAVMTRPLPATMPEWRAALSGLVLDRRTPLALRYDLLRVLSYSTCGSPSGIVRGPGAATRDAFATVRRDFARFESERAWLDLVGREIDNGAAAPLRSDRGIGGLADAVARIYFNPRIGTCAIVALGAYPYPTYY